MNVINGRTFESSHALVYGDYVGTTMTKQRKHHEPR